MAVHAVWSVERAHDPDDAVEAAVGVGQGCGDRDVDIGLRQGQCDCPGLVLVDHRQLDPDDGVPLRVRSAVGVLVVLDPHEEDVARLGLVVQGGLGQQLAGGCVEVEEVGADPAQAVGQGVAVEVRGGDGLADVGARRRVLGYRAGCPVAFHELRGPVRRRAAAPAPSSSPARRWRGWRRRGCPSGRGRLIGPFAVAVGVEGAAAGRCRSFQPTPGCPGAL